MIYPDPQTVPFIKPINAREINIFPFGAPLVAGPSESQNAAFQFYPYKPIRIRAIALSAYVVRAGVFLRPNFQILQFQVTDENNPFVPVNAFQTVSGSAATALYPSFYFSGSQPQRIETDFVLPESFICIVGFTTYFSFLAGDSGGVSGYFEYSFL